MTHMPAVAAKALLMLQLPLSQVALQDFYTVCLQV